MNKAVGILTGGVLMLAIGGPAVGANRKAGDMVESSMKEQAALLARYPALTQIDGAVRADCAAKNSGKLPTSDFCGCASAVTMQLWRSGMDPKMMPRLQSYLKNPTEPAAAEFVQYQGPELYGPVCKVSGKN
jgi:hypothetical protein